MQSDFNLLAIRLEREERKQISGDVEDSMRPRSGMLPTSNFPINRRLSGHTSSVR